MRLHTVALAGCLVAVAGPTASSQAVTSWPVHSLSRPKPPVVDPGPFTASAPPPSDAVVLFDGRTLSEWRSAGSAGGPARWKVADGYMEVVGGTGGIVTARSFGDVQLHLEWASPASPTGEGQERGNSGVIIMGRYEVQVLDTYRNETYADGYAAALYGQYPPLVNVTRPPGQWQTYDIVFRRPRFDQAGKLLRPARVTVLHNGVLVQDAVTLTGPTSHQARPPYAPHPDRLPFELQDHGSPVRFRNIWVRELADADQ
jgi:hypothetical protein